MKIKYYTIFRCPKCENVFYVYEKVDLYQGHFVNEDGEYKEIYQINYFCPRCEDKIIITKDNFVRYERYIDDTRVMQYTNKK